MTAAQFSQQWWNDQALARGNRLTKGDIEALTGMTFQTVWLPNNTIDYFWYKDVENRAPGFKGAGLLLGPATSPAGFDVMTVIGNTDYPAWQYFVSAVGYVAPGTTIPYNPPLSTAPPPPVLSPAPTPPPPPPPVGITPPPSQTPPPPPSTTANPTAGISGAIPPAPSAPAGSSPSTLGGAPNPTTVAQTNSAPSTTISIGDGVGESDSERALQNIGTGYPFAPNVPKWLVWLGGVAAILLLFNPALKMSRRG